jgi:uncharacterized BrkB/YihY/UPF0761 family membrane protein
MLEFLKEFWYTLVLLYALSITVIFCGRVLYQLFFFGLKYYDADFWNWTMVSFIVFTAIYLLTLILYSYLRDKHFGMSRIAFSSGVRKHR